MSAVSPSIFCRYWLVAAAATAAALMCCWQRPFFTSDCRNISIYTCCTIVEYRAVLYVCHKQVSRIPCKTCLCQVCAVLYLCHTNKASRIPCKACIYQVCPNISAASLFAATEHTQKGSRKSSNSYAIRNNLLQSVLYVQLTALLTASSSSRGGISL